MEPASSRRGLLPRPLIGGAVAGLVVLWLRLEPHQLSRLFLDAGFTSWLPVWLGAVVLVIAGMIGVLASPRVPATWGRHAAGGAFLLLSLAVAAAEIRDPATALAVGGCLGVLAAVAGWVAFGVEGEGGVVWLGAIVAGLGGIVFMAFVGGLLNELAEGGAVWASVAGEFFDLGALAIGGALPAAAVLFLQKRLEPWDRAMLNALAGLVAGALLAATLRAQ